MKTFKIGDRVKMTEAMKRAWTFSGSSAHIEEFGECVGLVVGPMFKDTNEFIDVKWQPSNLKYGYSHNELMLA